MAAGHAGGAGRDRDRLVEQGRDVAEHPQHLRPHPGRLPRMADAPAADQVDQRLERPAELPFEVVQQRPADARLDVFQYVGEKPMDRLFASGLSVCARSPLWAAVWRMALARAGSVARFRNFGLTGRFLTAYAFVSANGPGETTGPLACQHLVAQSGAGRVYRRGRNVSTVARASIGNGLVLAVAGRSGGP